VGVELTRKIALDDHDSESAMCGLYHGGAAAFDPIELDPIAVRLGQQAPRNRHPALRHRQSTVFGGVGGEFVQGEAEILRCVRLEQHSWAFDENLLCFGVGSRRRSAPQVSDLIDTEGVTRARLFTISTDPA